MVNLILSLAVILGICFPALAEGKKRMTLEDAITFAKKEVPGEVVKAEFDDGIYEVKIMSKDGESIKVKIDPDNGSIIRKGKILKGSSGDFSKP